MSVCFFFNKTNKAIPRRDVEANGAIVLQTVEAPCPVCQLTASKEKKNISAINQASVFSGHA